MPIKLHDTMEKPYHVLRNQGNATSFWPNANGFNQNTFVSLKKTTKISGIRPHRRKHLIQNKEFCSGEKITPTIG